MSTQQDAARSPRTFRAACASLWEQVRNLGPGLITGAADDDPSGISTYSVAGASTGLTMLWLAMFTTPMMAVVQGMCARIGMVTGMGLAANIRRRTPLPLAYTIALAVVAANTFNVGADFAGMAESAHMVVPAIPTLGWVVGFGLILLGALFFCSYRVIADVIKVLTLALLAYVVTAFVIHPPWGTVFAHLVIPHVEWNKDWVTTAMGVLGTTITPYLFFWQSSLMVEEEKDIGRVKLAECRGATRKEIRNTHIDVNVGMIASNLVMFFIIVTTAFTLYGHGGQHIETAQQAAQALQPLAGRFASVIFMLGMVGTGLLAIPALAGSSAYVAAETFAFRGGLSEKPDSAPRFYAVLGAGILLGMLMPLMHVNAIKALYWSAVVNGVVAVPLLFFVVRIAGDAGLMGKWVSSPVARAWGWITVATMSIAAVALFIP